MNKKLSESYQPEKLLKKKSYIISTNKNKQKKIDFSDIPTLDFDKLGKPIIGKFYRPLKKPISIRIDADVLDWFKSQHHYQRLINYACRLYMEQCLQQKKSTNRVKAQKPRPT